MPIYDYMVKHMGSQLDRAAWNLGNGRIITRALTLSLLMVLAFMSGGQGNAGTGSGGSSPTSVPTSRRASNIAVITIKGEITKTTAPSVVRRIGLAERAGAEAIVFEIDTPGGDFHAVLQICTAIKACPIKNTVAWINRDAYSGGAIIALACREIVVNDPSSMGDALPVQISSPGGAMSMPEDVRQNALTQFMSEIVDSARRNNYDELLVQGIASRGVELWMIENLETHRRISITRAEYEILFRRQPSETQPGIASAAPTESEAAQGAQSENRPKGFANWYQDALKKGPGKKREPGRPSRQSLPYNPEDPNRFVPAAPELAELAGEVTQQQDMPSARPVITAADAGKWRLVEQVSNGNGLLVFKAGQMQKYGLATEVVRNDEELKAYFGAKHLLRMNQTWSEGMVAILTWLPVQGLLIAIFLIALFIEMTHPGLIAPGAIAAGALILLIAPPLLIDMANWWEIAAIFAGMILVALEIFVIPGFGFAGVLGLLLLFGGLIGTLTPQGTLFPDSPRARNDLLYGVTTLVMSLATSGVAMYFISKHFKTLPFLNRLVLKDPVQGDDLGPDLLAAMAESAGPVRRGMIGTAITPLRPAGRVEMGPGGRIIDVVADLGFIPAGAKVKITSVSDFRIGVEKAET